MKKGFGSGVGSGSIPRGYWVLTQKSGSGFAPKCHGSPALVIRNFDVYTRVPIMNYY
jgi:hypothetical protein